MAIPQHSIARIFREQDDFLVASHLSPDGDALGSTAAVGHILAKLGKTFTLYNVSDQPSQYDWMPMPGGLHATLPDKAFSFSVILDCGAISRIGDELAGVIDPSRTVTIDHHLGNPGFGVVDWVDTAYSSTGEMVAELADILDVPLEGDLAEAVYAAVVTDTGYFSYGHTRPETLELAARLMRGGLDVGSVNAKIQNQWSVNRLRLFTEVLRGLTLHCDGKVGTIRITRPLLDAAGAKAEDCDGLINYALRIKGVKMAVSVRETKSGQVKFSLRSSGDINVQQIASRFGGGGHKNASGGSIVAETAEAERMLLDAAAEILEAGTHG